MTTVSRNEPWRVTPEQFGALEVHCTPELLSVAKKLAARLGRSTGHKEASLYVAWKAKVGPTKASKWWSKH